MQALPIQTSPMIHIPARASGGTKSVATMAAFGIHHDDALARGLLSQSREAGRYRLPWRLSPTARSSTRLTRTLGLGRRARDRAIGTEHATIARLRPQRCAAASTGIEKLAGIGWHGLRFCGAAMRTGDDRFEDHGVPKACGGYRRLQSDIDVL